MREIHDARDAEDQRQAGGDQKQRRRAGKTREELDDEELHADGEQRRRSAAAARRVLRPELLHLFVGGHVVGALVIGGMTITPLPSLSAVLPTNAPIVDWWSIARKVTGPNGVSNETPSAAAIILSVGRAGLGQDRRDPLHQRVTDD